MCTLIAIHRHIPGAPLVVAANRDEFYDRPAQGPVIWNTRRGAVLAPQDLRAGGTWLGLNGSGVFAALTNRPCQAPDMPDMSRRSRGLLVLDALASASAGQAVRELEQLPEDEYNPFNLFVADAKNAFALVYRDRVAKVRKLEPGAHVIGNADPDDRRHAKTDRILRQVEEVADLPGDEVLDALSEICREHGGHDERLGDTCIHLDGYGTRSSMLLRLNENESAEGDEVDWKTSALLHAEGPPCEAPYRNITTLLHELSEFASYNEGEKPARKAS
jgi:uncharacterized protein with NRDE domain